MKKEDKKALKQVELELAQSDALTYLKGIERCTVRLTRLIELNAPVWVVEHEVRMIQYRALSILASYEIKKELMEKHKEEKDG